MSSTIVCLAISFALSMGACGPSGYIKNVTMNASSSVAAAKAVGAEKWAPYEYTRAIEFLHKAKEEASYADFQAANRFGRLAHKSAKQAKKLAVERSANKDDTSWQPPPSLRDKNDSSKDGNSKDGADGEMAPADDGDDDNNDDGNNDDGSSGDSSSDDNDAKKSSDSDDAGNGLAPADDAGDDNNTSGDTL